VSVVKCFVPNQKISKDVTKLFEDLGGMVKKFQGLTVEYERLTNDLPVIKQIAKESSAISIVGNYEAIYLETFYEFTPLFKIANAGLKGLVVAHRDAKITRLADIENQMVFFPECDDWLAINPVVLFMLQKCRVVHARQLKNYATKMEPLNLFNVIDKKAMVAVTNSFEYNLIPGKERKRLKIFGEFPIIPEYIVVAGPDLKNLNGSKLKSILDIWSSKYADNHRSLGMQILPYEASNHSLLVEAIEGLGFSLKNYVEDSNDLLISSISAGQKKELQEIEQKYHRLKNFNDKLVKMYQDVRDSRDRLTREIESTTNNTVLFLRDGKILGCSRGLCTLLKYGRQEAIGQQITKFVKPTISTPFKKLIQQIDVGLVRSFVVNLISSNGSKIEAKMEFSIIELIDSKVILGVISKIIKS